MRCWPPPRSCSAARATNGRPPVRSARPPAPTRRSSPATSGRRPTSTWRPWPPSGSPTVTARTARTVSTPRSPTWNEVVDVVLRRTAAHGPGPILQALVRDDASPEIRTAATARAGPAHGGAGGRPVRRRRRRPADPAGPGGGGRTARRGPRPLPRLVRRARRHRPRRVRRTAPRAPWADRDGPSARSAPGQRVETAPDAAAVGGAAPGSHDPGRRSASRRSARSCRFAASLFVVDGSATRGTGPPKGADHGRVPGPHLPRTSPHGRAAHAATRRR